ncbi:SPOR domain-containing protein [Oceanimonas baumannii]|uniref:Cell division protein FtsN n=1 Tax=Oceanimonas baumannii TaxID=129578 RepID=A0A235CGM7_9GAMM|nr:SPOR domain-containing protein [Oceanimonas baumannii]MCC4264272.1 SPOR domain-containing protein [Oceanimonas baumannii]OYD23534.1 sporulation protein [Oceanimonas baumannii]TDW56930.1 cell division protein FtsN [Oceanimonas baumannii]
MPRDYVRRSPPQKKGGNKPRTGSRSRAPERRTPWLAIIFAVLLLGGLGYIIFLIKGSAGQPPAATPPPAAQQPPPAPAKKVNPIDQKPVEKWRYIEQLENKEIVVSTPKPAEERKKPDAKPKIYYMQCGSFRSSAQAEQLKARIAFQGLTSEVKRSEGSNGVWYRVVMGPYDSKRKADQAKHKMNSINTSCIVLQG